MGSPVSMGEPLFAELGPGLLSCVYDGLQRPLDKDRSAAPLDRTKRWPFVPQVRVGDLLRSGDVIGTVQETERIVHRITVPDGLTGTICAVEYGSFHVDDTIAVLEDAAGERHSLCMLQRRALRSAPSVRCTSLPAQPLRCGMGEAERHFPPAKGGSLGILCASEADQTMLLRQLAAKVEADVVIYVGCGIRGDAAAALLQMQPEQKQERILIAAAADQPAAQRAIALDTGMTIADYFRGMGCDAVVIVDDLSRWADALRVLSAELGEQPAAAGYPADLASRLAFCFARAGEADGGSVTLIAAAADRDDPVQDALMRCAGAVWTMDDTMQPKWAQSGSRYGKVSAHGFACVAEKEGDPL